MLDEVVEQLDESLFTDYVKTKAAVVNDIVRKGISGSGMDWYETPRPTGESTFIILNPLSADELKNIHLQKSAIMSIKHSLRSCAFTLRSLVQLSPCWTVP